MVIKRIIPKKIRVLLKDICQYYYVVKGFFNRIEVQKICFFYLQNVPDFGKDFLYFKLGKKEELINPKNYSIIYEADLPINLSKYNEYLLDYSGLYALYANNIVTKDYLLLIHYDTKIKHKKWIEIICERVRHNNIVFSTWPIKEKMNEVEKWVYCRINDLFTAAYNKSFDEYLNEKKIFVMPNTSQFACKRDTFYSLMNFLYPLYDQILKLNDKTFLYAHLLEKAWGLYFALTKYKTVPVIMDSHTQEKNYVKKAEIINKENSPKLESKEITKCR